MAPSLTPEAWAQVRYDYEHTDRPIYDICAEYRISDTTLRDRVRRWAWTRRRPPIPRRGPPAIMPPVEMTLDALTPTPSAQEPAPGRAQARPAWGGEQAEPGTPIVPASAAEADIDPATIVPRLQGAIARVLPAVEAALTRLTAGPLPPREMEQVARTLGALMRTLRELNTLLRDHPAHAANDDPVPKDPDEMRFELARRIRAFIENREAAQREAAQREADQAADAMDGEAVPDANAPD